MPAKWTKAKRKAQSRIVIAALVEKRRKADEAERARRNAHHNRHRSTAVAVAESAQLPEYQHLRMPLIENPDGAALDPTEVLAKLIVAVAKEVSRG